MNPNPNPDPNPKPKPIPLPNPIPNPNLQVGALGAGRVARAEPLVGLWWEALL